MSSNAKRLRINGPSNNPFITLDRVTIRVREQRLFNGSCWSIGIGQDWAVIGPNGSGKTSLVRAIAGWLPIVEGKIHYHQPSMAPQDIGYLSFESHRNLISREERREESRSFSGQFNNHLTVRQLLKIEFDGQTAPSTGSGGEIDQLDLAELLGRPIRGLSTGEVRRVLIAQQILKRPPLIILDEPFDGLDTRSREKLTSILDRLMEAEIRIILVTHRLREIPSRISHILGVKSGRVVFQGERRGLGNGDLLRIYGFGNHPIAPWPNQRGTNYRKQRRSGQKIIDMQDVTVGYDGMTVISRLNWTVRSGENWTILGPNGAGKSTLLNLIVGDHPQAYANSIKLFGRQRGSGESIWEIKRHIGLVSSEFQIRYRKKLLAGEVVLSGFFDSVGLYRSVSGSQRRMATVWMERLGCSHLAGRWFQLLSQGEQRLVLLARAMVKSPRLLILDEPCQGLDRTARQRILHLLDGLGFDSKTQLLYVTHQPDERLACITHVLQLEETTSGTYRVRSAGPCQG